MLAPTSLFFYQSLANVIIQFSNYLHCKSGIGANVLSNVWSQHKSAEQQSSPGKYAENGATVQL